MRTYFSATLYRPSGETIGRVTMPELEQAESIAYTADGRSLLAGSEGPRSPVYRVPLPAGSTPTPSPLRAEEEQKKEPSPVARAEESDGGG
ncbi:hypothetical protein ACFQQB_20030 [Nonomuraea rubra]|uniref:hypothetical protein n=1 Tax=Nonomuraea rubra TaxID=46180 RepID=UPI003623D387